MKILPAIATVLGLSALVACDSNTGEGTDSAAMAHESESESESESETSSEESESDSEATEESTDGAEEMFRLSLTVELATNASGEALDFLTPSGNVISMAVDDVVGRPYYFGVYPGGFGQGVDLALYEQWGHVSEALKLEVSAPAEFPVGPYDLALIVYTQTEITDDDRSADQPPVPIAGELSSFTLSQSEILDGDPGFSNGVVRVNIVDGDAALLLENRTDLDLGVDVFTNTVLTVP